MKEGALYREIAQYYDLLYHKKNYKDEVMKINDLIKKYKPNDGNKLLDIGCGTGNHISHLKEHYHCKGVDISENIINVAREKNDDIEFFIDDMTTFHFDHNFDIIISMFGTLGYCKSLKNLLITLNNLYNHLETGGLLIFEPWFSKSNFIDGMIFLTTYDGDEIKIARVSTSKKVKDISRIQMEYLIAKKGYAVVHYSDIHELGLFEKDDTLNIMKEIGFKAQYLDNLEGFNQGIYIGIKEV